jgi:hypothetical protein
MGYCLIKYQVGAFDFEGIVSVVELKEVKKGL